MSRISVSTTPEIEEALAEVPIGLRSQLIRCLLRAYAGLAKETGPRIALGQAVSGNTVLKVREIKK